jgi:hypothetical protein
LGCSRSEGSQSEDKDRRRWGDHDAVGWEKFED